MNSKELKLIVAYVKVTLCKWFGRTEKTIKSIEYVALEGFRNSELEFGSASVL